MGPGRLDHSRAGLDQKSPAAVFLRSGGKAMCAHPGSLVKVIWKMLGSHSSGYFIVHQGVISEETLDNGEEEVRSWG